MTRIAAATIDQITFREQDNPPTRTQKLELLRRNVARPQHVNLSIIGLPSVPATTPLFRQRVRGETWTFGTANYADASIAATGTPALRIRKNGVQVGTIAFAGTTGTVSALPVLVSGDLFEIYPPAVADATLDQLSVSLQVTIV